MYITLYNHSSTPNLATHERAETNQLKTTDPKNSSFSRISLCILSKRNFRN